MHYIWVKEWIAKQMRENDEFILVTVNAKTSSNYSVEIIYSIYRKLLMNY